MEMKDRLKKEFDLVASRYGQLEISPNFDWVIIKFFNLTVGWSKGSISVLLIIPPGYPLTPPDNFFTDPELRLANGSCPTNCSEKQTQIGRLWLQFSYHVESGDWNPHAEPEKGHNLLTFLKGVETRLGEGS
jgi:hypothetical protein